jgi:hypothetical protein
MMARAHNGDGRMRSGMMAWMHRKFARWIAYMAQAIYLLEGIQAIPYGLHASYSGDGSASFYFGAKGVGQGGKETLARN